MARQTILHVEGMTCMMCVKHVENALKGIEGVESARVSLSDKRAFVTHEDSATIDQMIATVAEAGYQATVEV